MKKIYSLLLAFIPMLALAQPTIDQSDLPMAGLGWRAGNDTNFTGPILSGGANQTWNYGSLVADYIDSTEFIATAGTPYASSFPTANVAQVDQDGWTYFISNSTGFYLNGGNFSGGNFLVLNPAWLYFPAGFTYGNTRNSVARSVTDTTVSGYPYRSVLNIQTTIVGDGYGTLILPTGTFTNVLRTKVTNTITDSAFIDYLNNGNYTLVNTPHPSTTVDYRWVRHGVAGSGYLMNISADSAGTVPNEADWLINTFDVSTRDISADRNLHIYPNPSSEQVRFDLGAGKEQFTEMRIYNAFGQEVFNEDVKGMSYLDVPVSSFSKGIYYYSIYSDSERISGNFAVQH